MTPTCINRTDKPPKYRIEQAERIFRCVQDDDGQEYRQQLNADGLWSEWHEGDWPGDSRAVNWLWINTNAAMPSMTITNPTGTTVYASMRPTPEPPKGWLGRKKG